MTQALETLLRPLVEKADWADKQREVWGRQDLHDGYTVSIKLGTCRKIREALNTRKPCDAGLRTALRIIAYTTPPIETAELCRDIARAALSKGGAT